MDAFTLEFHDVDKERAYKAQQFRGAFGLHVSYSIALLIMFAIGALDSTFRVALMTLAPGFVAVLIIRLLLHYSKIWILRNQPLETQHWNFAQFLSSY